MKETCKSYFKIMQIVYLIFGIMMCITIVGAVFGIPVLIGSKKFKQASMASEKEWIEKRSSLLVWAICLDILTAPVGFIALVFAFIVDGYIKKLALIKEKTDSMTEEEREKIENKSLGQTVSEGTKSFVSGFKNTFGIKSEEEKLLELKKLYDDKLLTEEEYQAKKKKILKIG